MEKNVTLLKYDNKISIQVDIQADEIMAIGQKMEEINEEAYMNGYNWETFFNYYFEKTTPELYEIIECDSEAGTYVIFFDKSDANEQKAEQIQSIIVDLFNNPDKIYQCMKDNDGEIEWD